MFALTLHQHKPTKVKPEKKSLPKIPAETFTDTYIYFVNKNYNLHKNTNHQKL